MHETVGFQHQLCLSTMEIQKIISERMLSSEFVSGEPTITQYSPKLFFGPGRLLSQSSGSLAHGKREITEKVASRKSEPPTQLIGPSPLIPPIEPLTPTLSPSDGERGTARNRPPSPPPCVDDYDPGKTVVEHRAHYGFTHSSPPSTMTTPAICTSQPAKEKGRWALTPSTKETKSIS